MLVIVMAVVLLLVARVWEKLAPTASQLPAAQTASGVDSHGQDEAAEAASDLPNLEQTRKSTDEHAERLQQALDTIE